MYFYRRARYYPRSAQRHIIQPLSSSPTRFRQPVCCDVLMPCVCFGAGLRLRGERTLPLRDMDTHGTSSPSALRQNTDARADFGHSWPRHFYQPCVCTPHTTPTLPRALPTLPPHTPHPLDARTPAEPHPHPAPACHTTYPTPSPLPHTTFLPAAHLPQQYYRFLYRISPLLRHHAFGSYVVVILLLLLRTQAFLCFVCSYNLFLRFPYTGTTVVL